MTQNFFFFFGLFPLFYSMPRKWKHKSDSSVPTDILRKAAVEVRKANDHSICHVTLSRYCKASQKPREEGSSAQPNVGYRSQRVLSDAQEEILNEYLKEAADLYYGLTTPL